MSNVACKSMNLEESRETIRWEEYQITMVFVKMCFCLHRFCLIREVGYLHNGLITPVG